MKYSALFKDTYREIRKTKGRFISISLLIALSVFVYVGLKAAGPMMNRTTGMFYDGANMADIKVSSTLMLSDADYDIVSAVDGVKFVERINTVDLVDASHDLTLKVLSAPRHLSTDVLMEGKYPSKEGEAVCDYALSDIVKIGDVIDFSDSPGNPDMLACKTFTVTGYVRSVDSLSLEQKGVTNVGKGELDGFISVLPENFDTDDYGFFRVAVDLPEDIDRTSIEYSNMVKAVVSKIENMLESRPTVRLEEVRTQAVADVEEGTKKIEDAKNELETNERKLEDAKITLVDARKKYEDGEQELETEVGKAKADIADGEQQLREAREKMDKAYVDIADGEKKLADARKEFNERELEFFDAQKKLADAKKKLADGEKELSNAKSAIVMGYDEVEANRKELELAIAQLDAADARIESEEASARSQYASASAQLKAGISQAEAALSALPNTPEFDAQRQVLQQTLAGLKAQLSQLESVFSSGMDKISAAKAEVDSKRAEVNAGFLQVDEAQAKLAAAEYELSKGEREIEEHRAELADGQREFDEGYVKLEDGRKKLEDSEEKLKKYKAELVQGEKDYSDGLKKIADAKATLAREEKKGRDKLADALFEIEDGESEYEDAIEKFNSAKAYAVIDIADGEKKIADAGKKIAKLDLPTYSVQKRDDNITYYLAVDGAVRMGVLSHIFPVLFFMVALLVALTTMTRMVEEDRIAIGTLKALGYPNSLNTVKYFAYGASAAAIGWLIGAISGHILLPKLIFNAYLASTIFHHTARGVFLPLHSVIALVLSLACTALAAVLALKSELKENAASLMRPKMPAKGNRILLERIGFVWSRLSFSYKTTARNLFRYKKRMFMTLFGVAGCTALMFMGFGIEHSLDGVIERQFDYLTDYSLFLNVEKKATDEEKAELFGVLEKNQDVQDIATVTKKDLLYRRENKVNQTVTLMAPKNVEEFEKLVHLVRRRNGQTVSIDENGAIMTEKLAKLMGVSEGDVITLYDGSKSLGEIEIIAIVENYISHYIYVSEDTYHRVTGEELTRDTLLINMVKMDAKSKDSFTDAVLSLDGVAYVLHTDYLAAAIDDTLGSLTFVIAVIVTVSCLLAVVVLYNLTNINISERRRELSTLKVLGYHDEEITKYVYRETLLLTAIGIVIGFAVGAALHSFIMNDIVPDSTMMMLEPGIKAYIFSAVLTMTFSFVVMYMMHKKLQRVDMIESLKSVE